VERQTFAFRQNAPRVSTLRSVLAVERVVMNMFAPSRRLTPLPVRGRAPHGHLVSPIAVVLYATRPDVAVRCEEAATELRIAHAEAKHLQAACSAIAAYGRAMVIASEEGVRPWDREVLDDHAARAGVPVRWVRGDEEAETIADELRSWVAVEARRSRTAR
jgi:hypothetical protein